ncbi:MAG: hypothetical protein G01um101433_530 [Parcubacteria group bacterium Gr01-1014_33]|nr:MAG: hypothetical protein G01um101433_530 [Parcubacteria group bacterium Gr01-1014_33]
MNNSNNESNSIASGNASSPKKILIVDDDDMLAGIYDSVFRESGFEVLRAHDGKEAFTMLQEGKIPHIILTGIMMPRMSGFELVANMRQDAAFQSIPIAMISHRGLPEDEKKAHDMGIADFIVQHTTTPGEVVYRVKLMLGLENKFRIVFSTEQEHAKTFISFMDKQQITYCSSKNVKEMALEFEVRSEKGTFVVRLMC